MGRATAAAPARSRRAPARQAPVVRRLGPGEALRRRLSGPAPPLRAPRAATNGSTVALPGRVMRAPFARAARSRTGGLLDALLQGRAWVGLVGLLLAGIVFFNVDVLQLNREIAHTAERATKVKRENATLQLELAELGSSERIQSAAAKRGLQLPAPGDVRYLKLRPRLDGGLAASRIVAPGTDVETPVAAAPPAAQVTPTTEQPAATEAPAQTQQPATTTTPAPATPTPAPTDQQPVTQPTTGAVAAPGQ